MITKYKTNKSVVSLAAADVNIVTAGLLIGREQSLFIVLSKATGRPLVGGYCGDCTIQLARCTTTGSGQAGEPLYLLTPVYLLSTMQSNTIQYNALNKETEHCIET